MDTTAIAYIKILRLRPTFCPYTIAVVFTDVREIRVRPPLCAPTLALPPGNGAMHQGKTMGKTTTLQPQTTLWVSGSNRYWGIYDTKVRATLSHRKAQGQPKIAWRAVGVWQRNLIPAVRNEPAWTKKKDARLLLAIVNLDIVNLWL